MKYSFKNDYSEGAHERILKALSADNLLQEEGYGEDRFCMQAAQLIRDKIRNSDAAVHFVSGGTQANFTVISSMLKPYESVIAAETGHIAVHETGAIEACGHKINTVKAEDGKLSEENIQAVLNFHTDEHMVKPKAVFISNSTEIGSVYTRNELEKLSVFCRKNKLFLYLDGARLGSALASRMNDLTLADLAGLVDVFYIGGTKNGALLGEAVVILNDYIKENFRFYMKQKGALLAKGRILGIQFLELFKDELFFDLAGQANRMAFKLADGIKTLGFSFLTEPASNQIFPVLPDKIIAGLSRIYDFYVWCRVDENNSAIRLVTSWASDEEAAESFLEDLSSLKTKS